MFKHADSQLTPTEYVEVAAQTARSLEHRGTRSIVKARQLDGVSMLAMYRFEAPDGPVFEVVEQTIVDQDATFRYAYRDESDAEAVYSNLLDAIEASKSD